VPAQALATGRADFRNPGATSIAALSNSPMGTSYGYGWWMVTFQLFVILYTAYVTLKAPAKRVGAAALLAVLTTSTFLFSDSVYVGYGNGVANLVTKNDGQQIHPELELAKVDMAVLVLAAGLIIVDVANVLMLVTVAEDDAPAAAAPAKAAEAAAEV
jgi:hypothetical protein